MQIYNIFSAYVEGGGFFHEQPSASWLDNVTCYVGKIGLIFYLNKNKETVGKYITIDYLYKNVKYIALDSVNIDKNSSFQKNIL